MRVKSFKMVTGEEVVAEVVMEKSGNEVSTDGLFTNSITEYVLRRPHTLQFQQVGPGQIGLALVPWTLSNPAIDNLSVPASAVLIAFYPSDKVEQQYIEQTSGISLARTLA